MTVLLRRAAVAGGLILAGLLAGAPAAPASPPTKPVAPMRPTPIVSLYPPSELVLTRSSGTEATHVQRAVSLRCTPLLGGDHPNGAAACNALNAVSGHFTELTGRQLFCTDIYDPVTVTVQGVWRGSLVTYIQTFPSNCAMLRERGAVFDF